MERGEGGLGEKKQKAWASREGQGRECKAALAASCLLTLHTPSL